MSAQEFEWKNDFALLAATPTKKDEWWTPPVGESTKVHNQYNETRFKLKHKSGKTMDIVFRVHNDGLGFRYEFHKSGKETTMTVTDELTEFQMTADHTAWWIPGDYDSNEHCYTTSKVSEINGAPYNENEKSIYTQHIVELLSCQTPITMRQANDVHLTIHEAGCIDFPAMQLKIDPAALRFSAALIPSPIPAVKSTNKLPFNTPWRAIIISKDAAGIAASKLIYNLNDPSKIRDVSWIKPMKYVGIWWEMHVGKSTWDFSGSQDATNTTTANKPHGKHGATTANAKRHIDFAAKNGFDGVLIEGWNTGWEDWFGKQIDSVFSFTKPYPDYDIDYLSKYAAEKGVKIIMHHETSAAVPNYESQMEDAFRFMNKHKMPAVKTGYVGKIIPRGEWHDGQWMNNHYARVAETAAKFKIMVNSHESVRPTGLARTYPNYVACEASRGQEFNAWSKGNLPEHETILPFTRILGGGFDYTPGIFETRMSTYDPKKTEVVHTTVAKQLALYVTLYSPIQMAADLLDNYEKRPDVFQFIREVPADWSESHVLTAAVGDHITFARKSKKSDSWYIGAITDEDARDISITLDFLDKNATYTATIYEDGSGADWETNPYPVNIRIIEVKKGTKMTLQLAKGGGCAISLVKKVKK
ncbi:unnamed protein product [Darwinula stevensoni]|uniref:Alpha-glucosidase n=1 Tax=Darwinula stevensoni TaxID=69355 RepID=A0A7R9AF21_9CRUS|nr:unnamed protein product [Darwinula stevensoni]CAG0902878.1 unnamed protein product [Darwinula stevensoni]